MAVRARPVNVLPEPANVPRVDLNGGAPWRAGSFVLDGDGVDAAWHSHGMHQLQYAFAGVAEVRSARSHHILPPQQAAWIPAGLPHRTTLRHVRSIAVFFDAAMVQGADDRVRVLTVAPLLREMIRHAARWPIDRSEGDATADSFFETLALLTVEWLGHESPLCLPTTEDPVVQEIMDVTNADLASISIGAVCAAVGLSERTLRRRFSADVGMTWRRYLHESRLLRAMVLLAEPDRTVLDVSTAVGFESPSAFTRAFTTFVGESPTTYRARTASRR